MTRAFGSCRVIEEIGRGSLSTVYKAVQEPLGRTVAVKALKSTIPTSSPFATPLEREARVLAELRHPNIVSLFDFVRTADDLYLVLEYVDGKSLAELLERRKTLRPEAAAAIGAELARGLEHIHARGIVHRDIKPLNILLSKEGEVKLVDFGIARRERADGEDEPPDRLEGATAFGTPAYMSPEQILGELVDARSDLFSLGVVLYQMLAGVRPFGSDEEVDGRTVAQRIRRDPAKPLRELAPVLPRQLEQTVMRLLEKLPADRFASAASVAEELDEIVRSAGYRAPRALVVRSMKDAGLTQIATPFGAFSDVATALEAPPIGRAIAGFGAVFALMFIGAFFVQWGSRASDRQAPFVDGAEGWGGGSDLRKRGATVRVVVSPWAEVWVDGRYVETTPFARPLALSAGTHFVKLVHPDAEPETRTLHLAEGEAQVLEVSMRFPSKAMPTSASPATDAEAGGTGDLSDGTVQETQSVEGGSGDP